MLALYTAQSCSDAHPHVGLSVCECTCCTDGYVMDMWICDGYGSSLKVLLLMLVSL